MIRHLLAGAFALISLPAMAQTTSTYTDVNKCKLEDTQNDMFFRECKGPDGRMFSLLYDEGFAHLVVDFDSYSPAAAVDIEIGGKGKVFGEKLEWRMRDGKPCAVIARVSTDKGSRLFVTSLGKPARIFGVEKTNQAAQATSEAACDSVGKPYMPRTEIDPAVQGEWTMSGKCDDPNKVVIGPNSYSVSAAGQTISHSRIERRKASGRPWAVYEGIQYRLMGIPDGSDLFETELTVNDDEDKDRISVNFVSDTLEAKMSEIDGRQLKRCH